MSLKKRIVAWYTLWTLTLMAIIFLLFFSFSNTLSLRSLRHDVEEALSDASSLIRVRSGRLNFFSVDEVEDGIYILVFSSDGTLLFGREGIEAVSIGYQEGQRTLSLPDGHWIISDMMMDGYYIRAAARESTIYSMISSDYLLVLIAALVMVVISALGGYFIVSRAFLPLERLISTASEIADGDDLTKRLESSNAKESRELSSAFNSMLARLDDSFKKEKEFTDDASHELRTPLAVIKAESEYALGSIDDRAEVEQSLSTIIKETDRMARLISSLLELSRVDKGSIKINKSRFSLSSMLEGLSEEMSQMARERNLSFSSRLSRTDFQGMHLKMKRRMRMDCPFRKILVYLDGSEGAMSALMYSIMLAKSTEASLHVVYVVNTKALGDLLSSHIFIDQEKVEYQEDLKKDAIRHLKHAKKLADLKGIDIDTVQLEGSPHAVVLKYIKEHAIDLLILGSVNKIRSRRDELTSENDRMMRTSPCPALIVKDNDQIWSMFEEE